MFSADDIANEIFRSLQEENFLLLQAWVGPKMRERLKTFAKNKFNSGLKTIPDCPSGCTCSICLMEDFLL